MKKMIVFFLFIFSLGLINAESLSIDSIGKILKTSVITQEKETFLRYFPSEKSSFTALFGFYESGFSYDCISELGQSAALAPLYDCTNCFSFLFDSICSNDSLWNDYSWYLIPLLVRLSIDIKDWEADNINFFQDGVVDLLLSRNDIWEYLDTLTHGPQEAFWNFIFDGPIIHPELYQQMKKRAVDLGVSFNTKNTIRQSFKKVKKRRKT